MTGTLGVARRRGGPTRPGPVARAVLDGWGAALAGLSGGLVVLGFALGWRGVDWAAQVYRVQLFRHHGFVLWDSQWYGGHWVLDYSVAYPAVAATLGIDATAVLSAIVATAAFHRLVTGHFGPSARVASGLFAVSVVVQTAIGQLPFLAGEALGLCCLWALVGPRRRWASAGASAVGATLLSPLAGAFVALLALAWAAATAVEGGRRAHAVGLAAICVLGLAPVGVGAVLFPGAGPMPYPAVDWLWEAVVAAVLFCLAPARPVVLRAAIACFFAAALASELIPTAVGGNVGRMEDVAALPLAVAFCLAPGRRLGALRPLAGLACRVPGSWPARFVTEPAWTYRLALAVVAVPFAASQWTPAVAAMTSNVGKDWASPAYYAPLVAWLRRVDEPGPTHAPLARVEVVPTADHWEAAYVAPAVPLARGWERQLDVAHNPLFYGAAPLTARTYRSWLVDNGARYVALASAPLDEAGTAEAALVEAGVPGLVLVWHNADWRVYELRDAPAARLVRGPATLVALRDGRVALRARRPGPCLVRVRWSAHWVVSAGSARLAPAAGGWTVVDAARAGPIRLRASLHL